jgi:hypothetical protein
MPALFEDSDDEDEITKEQERMVSPKRTGSISERVVAARAAIKYTSDNPRDEAGVAELGLYMTDIFKFFEYVLDKKVITTHLTAMKKAHWVVSITDEWTPDRPRPNMKILAKLLAAAARLVDVFETTVRVPVPVRALAPVPVPVPVPVPGAEVDMTADVLAAAAAADAAATDAAGAQPGPSGFGDGLRGGPFLPRPSGVPTVRQLRADHDRVLAANRLREGGAVDGIDLSPVSRRCV